MGYSKQIAEAVREAYENKRKKAEADLEARRAEMYEKAPQLREIDRALSLTGLKLYGAALEGKDGLEDRIAALKKENTDLQEAKRFALRSLGKPDDYMSLRYECPKCQDTGSVNGRTCACVHKVMQQLRRQEIEALSSLSISSFDTMKLEYYPSVADPEVGESIRTYMAEVLADLRDYAADFSPATRESLLLLGNAGLGKTHAALAIAGEVLRQNYDVIYVSCPDFFGKLEALHFGSDPNGEEEALFQTASNADLLILDDLGTEFNSSFFLTNLYSLLNNRLGAKLPTIVTTNVTDGTLLEKLYTEKISSRLAGFVQIKFFGNDIRVQKANE